MAGKTSEKAEYASHVVPLLVALWKHIKRLFTFLDGHHGTVSACATVAIVGLTGVYVHYSRLQWQAMNDTLKETRKGADAAKSAAETTRNAFEIDKRRAEEIEEAKCTILGDIGIGERFYTVTIPNGGKASARGMHAHIEISLNALPSNRRIRLIKILDISQPELAANRPIEKMIDLSLTPQEWEGIIQTKKGLVETGTIQYENGFDRVVNDSVCRVLVAVPSPEDPQNRAHGSVPDCDRLQQFLSTLPKPK